MGIVQVLHCLGKPAVSAPGNMASVWALSALNSRLARRANTFARALTLCVKPIPMFPRLRMQPHNPCLPTRTLQGGALVSSRILPQPHWSCCHAVTLRSAASWASRVWLCGGSCGRLRRSCPGCCGRRWGRCTTRSCRCAGPRLHCTRVATLCVPVVAEGMGGVAVAMLCAGSIVKHGSGG